MAQPTSRTELKDYALRKLGFPVVDINVDDDQLEDRIDDAIQLYQEFHYDGTEKVYLAHTVTANNIATHQVQLADSIIGVKHVLPISSAQVATTSSGNFNIFDINYQLRLNDFYNLTSTSYTYYVIARQHLELLNMIITGELPYEFNKRTHTLDIHMNWSGRVSPNDLLMFEATRIVDPTIYADTYKDSWLKNYTTCLFKEQWGTNLTKYGNFTLPGGIVINGDKILLDAQNEKEELLQTLRDTYEEPAAFLVG
jgi:hypothetical protein